MKNGLLEMEKPTNRPSIENANQYKNTGLLGQITHCKESDLSDTQKHNNIFNTDGGLLDDKSK